jgi:hypothetical protein
LGNPKYGALGVLILPLGFLAVFGGLIAFAATLYHVTSLLIRTYTVTEGVPLSFTLGNLVPTDTGAFFDFPISLFAALSAVAAAGIIAFTIIGKNVSKTPGALSVGMLAYLFVYGFIAPFWLLRSVRDVALNTHRGWR